MNTSEDGMKEGAKHEWVLYIGNDKTKSINADGMLTDGDHIFTGTVDQADIECKRRAAMWVVMEWDLFSPLPRRFYCASKASKILIAFDVSACLPPSVAELLPRHTGQ